MSVSFSQTVRSLNAVSPRYPAFAKLFVLLVFMGWCLWFFNASFPLYETSESAALHVTAPLVEVEAAVAGQVIGTPLTLGAKVTAGQALLVLDSAHLEVEAARLKAEMAALQRKAAAVDKAWSLQQEAVAQADAAARSQLNEASARLQENRTRQADLADQEAREAALYQRGLTSQSRLQSLSQQSAGAGFAVEADRHARERLGARAGEAVLDRRIEMAELERERAEIDTRLTALQGQLAGLNHQIQRHTVRAPLAGVIADAPDWPLGAFVAVDERLVTILPDEPLRIVAWFRAEQALSRIRDGMPARMKLDGFPWTRYGRLRAQVAEVAGVADHGLIKVVLNLPPDQMDGVSLSHGLPGQLDIEVDRVSPAVFLLQLLGKDVQEGRP